MKKGSTQMANKSSLKNDMSNPDPIPSMTPESRRRSEIFWMEDYRLEAERENRYEDELHWRTRLQRLVHPEWNLIDDLVPYFWGEESE